MGSFRFFAIGSWLVVAGWPRVAAMRGLQANARLWQDPEAYIWESHSTGCGCIDPCRQ